MQETATRSATCRPNAKTEALILSPVVHQATYKQPRPEGTCFDDRAGSPLPRSYRGKPGGLTPAG